MSVGQDSFERNLYDLDPPVWVGRGITRFRRVGEETALGESRYQPYWLSGPDLPQPHCSAIASAIPA